MPGYPAPGQQREPRSTDFALLTYDPVLVRRRTERTVDNYSA